MFLLANKIKKTIRAYEKWVTSNVDMITTLETIPKFVLYYIAVSDQIGDSTVLSEAIYSLSNLLIFYNDCILYHRKQYNNNTNNVCTNEANATCISYRLKVLLTTVEYSEVLLEITTKRAFGVKAKWLTITLLQITKTVIRYFIIKYSKEQIICSPALASINRSSLRNGKLYPSIEASHCNASSNSYLHYEHTFTFKLKRSGHRVRKIEGAPPFENRIYNLNEEISNFYDQRMPRALKIAEYFYISKPLFHLATMRLFGEKSWMQYLVALLIDLASISIYRQNKHLMSRHQRSIVSHRGTNLLIYLARSPFYECFVQNKFETILRQTSISVPLLRFIINPLREYLPQWQNTYFHQW